MNSYEVETSYRGFKYYYKVFEHKNPKFEPTLFISGAFQDMNSWKNTIKQFTPETTAIVADLPGTGKSDVLPEDYDNTFYIEPIKNILNELSIPKIYIVSASYGTPLAYLFAQKYPERITSLVLAGTMKEIPSHVRKKIEHSVTLAGSGQMKNFADYVTNSEFLCNDFNKSIERRRLVRKIIYNQLLKMSPDEVKKYVANTNRLLKHAPLDLSKAPPVRTLIFTGENDTFTKPLYSREMAFSFPNAVYTTIKNADHIFHIEQFEVVMQLLLRFVKNLPLEEIDDCNTIEYTNSILINT